MKKTTLSIFLGGMVVGLGLLCAPMAHAEELQNIPDHNQLNTELDQQANSEVNTVLLEHEITADQVTTTETTTQPDNTGNASNNEPIIINTGGNADVDTSLDQSSDTEVSNDNQADVDQTVNASANTGDNEASRNISFGGNAGMIQTGDATVVSDLATAANNNQTGISGSCPTPTDSNANLVNTGDNLDYDAGSDTNCTTTVSNGNDATINQVVNAEAETGDNVAERNIAIGGGSAGVITTGDANVGSLVATQANGNTVMIVGGQSNNGTPGNGASIYLINTGGNATLDSRRRSSTDISVDNDNYAEIDQLADIEANTGGNDSSRNINTNGDAGVIVTGDATVVTEISATANSNQTAVSAENESGKGNGTTEIVNTGDNLEVDGSSESETEVEVDNNNTADVDQEVNVIANTGDNTANRNIAFNGDAGVIVTGDATVVTTLETDVNSNATVVSGLDSEDAANNSTEIVNTGDDLEVDVSSETETEIKVTNDNDADINQNVNVAANTGDNQANRNIGDGSSITTGNITVDTEIITSTNNNYTFIVDSSVTGLELFQQFVEQFLGVDWDTLVGNGTSNGSLPNHDVSVINTGDDATIVAEHSQTRQVIVDNDNEADVNQQVNVDANTGDNQCNRNVGGCDIITGDVTIISRLIAHVNDNWTFIVDVPNPHQPEQPEEPEEPTTPEQPEEPQAPEEDQDDGLVLGEDVERERPSAVLAATTLPMTGGANFAVLGLLLVTAGLGLNLKKAKA